MGNTIYNGHRIELPSRRGEMDVKTVVYRFSHRGLCAITLIVNHSRFKLLCLTNTPLIFERFASRSFSNRSPLEEGML